MKPDLSFFVMGHSDSDADTLASEYFRDLAKRNESGYSKALFPG